MRIVFVVLLVLVSSRTWAVGSSSVPLYLSGFLDRQSISLAGEKFRPVVASASVGAWVYEGVALELAVGTSVSAGNVSSLELAPESQLSLGVRFESEPVNGIAAYASLSYTSISLHTEFTSGDQSAADYRFSGVGGTFGLTFPISQRLVIDTAFLRYEYGDDFGTNGFKVGVRYAVNDAKPRERGRWLR